MFNRQNHRCIACHGKLLLSCSTVYGLGPDGTTCNANTATASSDGRQLEPRGGGLVDTYHGTAGNLAGLRTTRCTPPRPARAPRQRMAARDGRRPRRRKGLHLHTPQRGGRGTRRGKRRRRCGGYGPVMGSAEEGPVMGLGPQPTREDGKLRAQTAQ